VDSIRCQLPADSCGSSEHVPDSWSQLGSRVGYNGVQLFQKVNSTANGKDPDHAHDLSNHLFLGSDLFRGN
jgi:hypothetical protein